MKRSSILRTALVTFLATGITLTTANAQTPSTQGRKAGTQQKERVQAKPVQASAPLVRTKVEAKLNLPVEGLTAENSEEVQSALSALKVKVYACEKCEAHYAREGQCTACKTPLTATEETVLKSVTTDPAKSEIVITTEPGMELRLSEVARALHSKSVDIDGEKFMISGNATLQVSGAMTKEQAMAIQSALMESKLFQAVHAQVTPKGISIRVLAASTPPTRAQVQDVLSKAGAEFKLHNVIWNDWQPAGKGAAERGSRAGAKKAGRGW